MSQELRASGGPIQKSYQSRYRLPMWVGYSCTSFSHGDARLKSCFAVDPRCTRMPDPYRKPVPAWTAPGIFSGGLGFFSSKLLLLLLLLLAS